MSQFICHLHPLLVHLPIGILLLAYVLECLARWFQQEQLRPAIHWALLFGLIASVLSATSGWMLAADGGYEEVILQRHRWLGIGTAGLFTIVWYGQRSRWYFLAFSVAVLTLLLTGHYGGSLTHGEDYLWKNEPIETVSTSTVNQEITPETPVFTELIQPILQEKCVSCHRPEKRKGNLVLSTEEGIQAGGKHGKILAPGNPDSSSLLQRIHLPLHHDDHMPPSGKPQLDAVEIQLIEWWIKGGADFRVLVKDYPLPVELSTALVASKSAPANPVFSLSVPMASSTQLAQLQALKIKVQSLGDGAPWLAASLAGQVTMTRQHWAALEAVSEQLVDLDLSHTAIQDQDLAGKKFPHLMRLNLAHTPLGNGAISFIQNSPFLTSLNLTNTLTGNELGSILPKLPHLSRLFLWQTKTTPDVVGAWKVQYPGMQIETGAAISADIPLTLRSPRLLYARSFFNDTMHLELDFPFKGVEIYYTLDEEASPTTQSPRYSEKIVLKKTAHLRAFAAKAGWQNSPLVEAMFVQKKLTIAGATLLRPPSPKYPAKGGASLIDGKISDAQGADTWLGFEGEHLEATLDLGDQKEISQVFVHCLENNAPWIFKPAGIQVATSLDGKKFLQQGAAKFPPNAAMGEQKVHLLGCHFPKPTTARYVRVRVESPLKNPAWHPGKGQKCWIFVDEMVVE